MKHLKKNLSMKTRSSCNLHKAPHFFFEENYVEYTMSQTLAWD